MSPECAMISLILTISNNNAKSIFADQTFHQKLGATESFILSPIWWMYRIGGESY